MDVRAVLYGRPLLEFIARESLAAFLRAPADDVDDAIQDIHAAWLLTAHADLAGLSPRQAMLAQRGHIEMDLQDQGHIYHVALEDWEAQQRHWEELDCHGEQESRDDGP